MLHLPAGFSISVLLGITTDGTPDSKEDLKARGNKTRLKKKKNAKSRVVADVGGKSMFSTEKRDGVQMAGEGTLDAETFQDPSVFTPPKTQAKGSTKKAKLTMKSKGGSFLEDPELGITTYCQLRVRNFCSVLPSQLSGYLMPKTSEGKQAFFFFFNQKNNMEEVPGLLDPIQALQLTHLKTLISRSIFH